MPGIKLAFELVVALGTETLERRFGIAFAVTDQKGVTGTTQ
ncbi:hypothetical protein Q5691_27340 [Microcoleus sp. w1-18aA5]